MADYKKLYFTLMRETEDAMRLLIRAQQHCEDLYMEMEDDEEENAASNRPAPPPPIQLFPSTEDPD